MRTHAKAVLICSALGFALIAPTTWAQDYGAQAATQDYDAKAAAQNAAKPAPAPVQENVPGRSPDNVFIVSPPLGRSWMGAPIVDVSISRSIRTDDLDLRTDEGVRQLRSRVFANAGALCRWMHAMYPIDNERGGWSWTQASPCYRNAVKNAMAQADNIIRAARGGSYAGYEGP